MYSPIITTLSPLQPSPSCDPLSYPKINTNYFPFSRMIGKESYESSFYIQTSRIIRFYRTRFPLPSASVNVFLSKLDRHKHPFVFLVGFPFLLLENSLLRFGYTCRRGSKTIKTSLMQPKINT